MRKLLLSALVGTMALIAAEPSIEEINWVAVELMGTPVPKTDARPTHIQLHSVDKKLTGFSGCNTISGGYEVSHEGLKFDPVGSTRMACAGANMEAQFLQALSSTKTFRMGEASLELQDMNGKVIARFTAAGPADPLPKTAQ